MAGLRQRGLLNATAIQIGVSDCDLIPGYYIRRTSIQRIIINPMHDVLFDAAGE